MIRVRRSDVVRVDLGTRDTDDTRGHENYKKRPAIVIQNDIGNRNSATTIVAPVTGGFTGYPFHVKLPASTPGFRKDSHAELDQIRTVDIEARILAKLGTVDASKTKEIDRAIEVSLGL